MRLKGARLGGLGVVGTESAGTCPQISEVRCTVFQRRRSFIDVGSQRDPQNFPRTSSGANR